MRPSKRDILIEHAMSLFQNHGFHATGIDTVLKSAGVAKMTLYNHFGSKDELILEVLRARREEMVETLSPLASDSSLDVFDRVLRVFDAVIAALGPGTPGCLFINAAAEYPPNCEEEVAPAVREEIIAYQEGLEGILRTACSGPSVTDPAEIARQLTLLVQGVIAGCSKKDGKQRVASARRAAEILLERYAA